MNLDISEGDVENASLPDVIAPVAGKSRAIFFHPDGRAAAVQSDDRRVTAVAFDLLQLSLRKTAEVAMMSLLWEP